MSLTFFGHFLIHRGVVTAEQLREALFLMEKTNPKLDHLAVQLRMITPETQRTLEHESRTTGHTFEELIEDEDLLSESQVNTLLQNWAEVRLRLGEALVRLKCLTRDELREHLKSYDEDQAPYRAIAQTLPGELGSHRPARIVVDCLCRMLPAMAKVRVKVDPLNQRPIEPGLFSAAIIARGVTPLRVELHAERSLAEAIARAMTGDSARDYSDADLRDAVAELLNVVVGNAVALLESDGLHLSLIPPDMNTEAYQGTLVGLVTTHGAGWLALDPRPRVPAKDEVEIDAAF